MASYNGVSYGYDASGNMTTRGNQSIKYDPEQRPVRVKIGTATVCRFAYDGDGIRRKRLDVNGTVHYVGAYERNVGKGDGVEVVTKYYTASFGNSRRLVAFRKGGTLYYVGTDHLGSTVRVADASFNPVDGMRYKAFGESRDAGANLQTDHKFTSQIEDAAIGLYWYRARAYDPAIGRFVQPDTVVPEAKNPQSLNRYTYVLNSPLRHSDPMGHREVEDEPGGGGANADEGPVDEQGVHARRVLPRALRQHPTGEQTLERRLGGIVGPLDRAPRSRASETAGTGARGPTPRSRPPGSESAMPGIPSRRWRRR